MQGRIIGAGIGGLVTAIALQRRGLHVSIYETNDHPATEGAGIMLAINAMRVADKLDLAEEIVQHGHEIELVRITDEKLQLLAAHTIPSDLAKTGYQNVAIHRKDLLDILTDHLQTDTVEWNKRCTRVLEKEQQCVLHFEDGTQAYGDYVVAADGIHSGIRTQLFPETVIRDMKQICWRGIVAFDLPPKYDRQAVTAWGSGRRFGFCRINEDFVYWYAVINRHGNEFNFRANLRNELKKQFLDFDPVVSGMIEDTAEVRIIRKDMMDVKPIPRWYAGHVCLLGDAAHAVSPALAQGACQAMEDAWVLAALLDESKNPGLAFPRYQDIRKPATDYVSKWSRRMGEIAHYENPLLTGIRNITTKHMPQSFFKKHMAKLLRPGYEI